MDQTMTAGADERVRETIAVPGEPGVYTVVFGDGSYFRTARPEAFGGRHPS